MAKFIFSARLGRMVNKDTGMPMIEDSSSWVPAAPMIVADIGEFTSPIDGALISSRAQLREYEKRHNVIQVGNDLGSVVDRVNKRHQEWKDTAKDVPTGWIDPE